MIDYKLCVCDMDGTLLNSNGLISKENERALKALREKGVEVIIASGRTDLMLKSFIKQLNLRDHIICCNGAMIKNIENGEIIYQKSIDRETVNEAIKYCYDKKVNFLVYTKDKVYSNQNNPRAKHYVDLNRNLPEELNIPIEFIEQDNSKFDDLAVFKILIIEKYDDKKDLHERHFSMFNNLSVVSSATGLLDIMAADISKGNAVKALSEKLGVDLREVIAFGDNYNDIEMFNAVGFPIAMENSVDEVKSVAKYITTSNDESGVAYAINNIFFEEL